MRTQINPELISKAIEAIGKANISTSVKAKLPSEEVVEQGELRDEQAEDGQEPLTKGVEALGEVPSEYFGYISALGAAIIQSGILPALIFFGEKGGGRQDRSKLMKAIMLMNDWEGDSLHQYYRFRPGSTVRRNNSDKAGIERQILDSAVALKLALRTFKKLEKDINPLEV